VTFTVHFLPIAAFRHAAASLFDRQLIRGGTDLARRNFSVCNFSRSVIAMSEEKESSADGDAPPATPERDPESDAAVRAAIERLAQRDKDAQGESKPEPPAEKPPTEG